MHNPKRYTIYCMYCNHYTPKYTYYICYLSVKLNNNQMQLNKITN